MRYGDFQREVNRGRVGRRFTEWTDRAIVKQIDGVLRGESDGL